MTKYKQQNDKELIDILINDICDGDSLTKIIEKVIKETRDYDNRPEEPVCCVCGTKENLTKDGWYGYRCESIDCMCY